MSSRLNNCRGVAEVLALVGVGMITNASIKAEATMAVVVMEERIFRGGRRSAM